MSLDACKDVHAFQSKERNCRAWRSALGASATNGKLARTTPSSSLLTFAITSYSWLQLHLLAHNTSLIYPITWNTLSKMYPYIAISFYGLSHTTFHLEQMKLPKSLASDFSTTVCQQILRTLLMKILTRKILLILTLHISSGLWFLLWMIKRLQGWHYSRSMH